LREMTHQLRDLADKKFYFKGEIVV
ncbi:MAG: hypothetical protein RL333_523, partial [Pseudomonadota bacterium]